jgi:hypothetical protein
MSGEKPIKQRRARAPDVQVPGRRGGESNSHARRFLARISHAQVRLSLRIESFSVAKAPYSVQRAVFLVMIQRYPANSAVAAALLLEVDMRNEVNQERADRRKESENSKPNKYESAFVLSFRRRRHSKDEMQSPK